MPKCFISLTSLTHITHSHPPLIPPSHLIINRVQVVGSLSHRPDHLRRRRPSRRYRELGVSLAEGLGEGGRAEGEAVLEVGGEGGSELGQPGSVRGKEMREEGDFEGGSHETGAVADEE